MKCLKFVFIFIIFITISGCKDLSFNNESISLSNTKEDTHKNSVINNQKEKIGSFATLDLADFLKMARSSWIGIHLFCQGLSDLSRLTPEFKNQIIGNTVHKILFRQDVGSDVEELAKITGTFSSNKKTYQITDTESDEEMTGTGTLREVKEMKFEFDVFKKLSQGQAVLIDKAFHKEDLFQVWRPVL